MREVFRPAAGTDFCVGCITYFLVLYQAVDCRFRRYRFEASCLYPLVESMYVACMFINVRMPPVLNFDECLVMFPCFGTILVSTRARACFSTVFCSHATKTESPKNACFVCITLQASALFSFSPHSTTNIRTVALVTSPCISHEDQDRGK